MPFCYAPWSNLDIGPDGTLSPCCKFQYQRYSEQPLNILKNTIQDYRNSQILSQVKQDFQQDRWPAGCERCRIEEENHIKSKRQLDSERWYDHYQKYDIEQGKTLTASIAFGNTCNLKCITCGPKSSSRWQKEYQALTSQNILPNHFYKKDFAKEFEQSANTIIHLDIPGGEPFLSGVTYQHQLLETLIREGRSQEISIHYTTNATIWPEPVWWDLWQNFREIDLQISIDAIEQRFEYIRFPANWKLVSENIVKYQNKVSTLCNFRLSVSHTVSAYNIYYLQEFFDWCKQTGLPQPWLGRVNTPVHMRPTVWPDDARQAIVDKLNAGNFDCQTWGKLMKNSDDSEHFDLFLARTRWHDQYRGVNFTDVFPEMSRYLTL